MLQSFQKKIGPPNAFLMEIQSRCSTLAVLYFYQIVKWNAIQHFRKIIQNLEMKLIFESCVNGSLNVKYNVKTNAYILISYLRSLISPVITQLLAAIICLSSILMHCSSILTRDKWFILFDCSGGTSIDLVWVDNCFTQRMIRFQFEQICIVLNDKTPFVGKTLLIGGSIWRTRKMIIINFALNFGGNICSLTGKYFATHPKRRHCH